ncbi:hypothetical protein GCM10009657_16400 [Oryzihumus leptocrescens]
MSGNVDLIVARARDFDAVARVSADCILAVSLSGCHLRWRRVWARVGTYSWAWRSAAFSGRVIRETNDRVTPAERAVLEAKRGRGETPGVGVEPAAR